MGSFSVLHWGIVLAIVMLVFGTGKLKNIGSDLGGAIKGFKEGMRDDAPIADTSDVVPAPLPWNEDAKGKQGERNVAWHRAS